MTRHDEPRNTENPAHPDDTTKKETPVTENTEGTTPAEPLARTLLGVPEGHGAPHYNARKIATGDYVLQVDEDGYVRAGRAHQHVDGEWLDENGRRLAWAARRAIRPDALTIWPAPTPPAEEVELPGEFGDVIRDVEVQSGEILLFDRLVWTGSRWTYRNYSTSPRSITAFTLPDGTRARRDGEREDGTPRFVQAQEGEK